MAKQKKFNIDNFVEEAGESVMVAETQRKKEQEERMQESLAATKVQQEDYEPYGRAGMVGMAQTAPQQTAMPSEPEKVAPAGKRGRPKSYRTIERVNGKIVYLEKETDGELARISILERFDKQDIIRTALHKWLEAHYDGNMLDAEGRAEIIAYIQRTTSFEGI